MSRPTEFFRRWVTGWCLLALPAVVSAYVTQKDDSNIYVVVWPPGPITMQIKLPAPSGMLLDGSTTYTAPILAGMQQWNNVIGVVRLEGQVAAPTGYANGNGINEIAMDSKADGEDFGENTLAITMSYRVGNEKTEADIVFNTAYTWDSYRGALRSDRTDIQRVAAHELGHVLGLGHPDEATPAQNVVALMNSKISSTVESPRTDDINGIRSLYGAPGFVPPNDNFAQATVLQPSGSSVSTTGTNIAATAETGEPNHDTETAARSVWWRWTAPGSAPVTLTTMGSNFDTVVGVYTGPAVGALTQVASNDDEDRGVVRSSKLTFNPVAGTTYAIAVDGWDASFGQIALALTQSAASGSAPSINSQPASQTVSQGGSVTFVVSTGGATAYQWFFNGSPISGATATSYTRSNVTAADAGNYHVVVTNAAGSVTSNPATLTVLAGTVTNQVVTTGHDVTLSAPAGIGDVRWQMSTDNGTTWANVADNANFSGATTTSLTVIAAGAGLNNASFRYTSTGTAGSVAGAPISLTVAPLLIPHPVALTVDGSGNFYVSDSSTHVVHKIDSSLLTQLLAGSPGKSGYFDGTGVDARFNQPQGLMLYRNELLVADSANAVIRKVTLTGEVTKFSGAVMFTGHLDGPGSGSTYRLPMGLANDLSGGPIMTDALSHIIRRLTSDGWVTTLSGTGGVAGAADGTSTQARFNYPTGIAVDYAGMKYVADTVNNLIRKVYPDGSVTTLAGTTMVSGWQDGQGANALFNQPRGMAVDAAGNIYVADTGNSAIRKITPGGQVSTLAGLPTVGGLKDGRGSEAWFNQPQGLAIDGQGTLYVADTGNAAIRKVTPDGAVTTLALRAPASTGGSPDGSTDGGGTPPVVVPSGGGSSSGGGGGGGAPSLWFIGAAAGLAWLRWWRLRRA